MSLQQKMLLSIGGLFTVVLLFLEVLGYLGARQFLLREMENEGTLLARYQAERVLATLNYAETVGGSLLQNILNSDIENEKTRFEALISHLMEGNPMISAIEVRGLSSGDTAIRRRQGDSIGPSEPSFPASSVADWREGKDLYPGVWRVPLTDSVITHLHHITIVEGLMVVVELPVRKLVAPLEKPEGGSSYGFLATRNTVLFASSQEPAASWSERSNFNAQVLLSEFDSRFYRVTEPFYGKSAWVGSAPVPGLDLLVGIVYLEDENFRHLHGLAWGSVLITVVGLGLLMLTLTLLSRSISRPLVELSGAVGDLAQSDFKERVKPPKKATREVEWLALSFNRMLEDLESYLGQLQEAAFARQAMDSELAIAAKIQDSILPSFPFVTDFCKADGLSRAARKVGGDFLSVFPVAHKRVGFLIGDVSGKGVPGAIYMAFTASLLEHLGRLGLPPADCFKVVNKALCERDESTMFATVFFGVLDPDGSVHFANAGHHPPMLFGGSRGFSVPKIDSGLALGVISEFEFEQGEFELKEGETVLLYTDGATEAMNCSREEFGDERFLELVSNLDPSAPLHRHLEIIERELEGHRGDAAPNDDVTLLVLKKIQ